MLKKVWCGISEKDGICIAFQQLVLYFDVHFSVLKDVS